MCQCTTRRRVGAPAQRNVRKQALKSMNYRRFTQSMDICQRKQMPNVTNCDYSTHCNGLRMSRFNFTEIKRQALKKNCFSVFFFGWRTQFFLLQVLQFSITQKFAFVKQGSNSYTMEINKYAQLRKLLNVVIKTCDIRFRFLK